MKDTAAELSIHEEEDQIYLAQIVTKKLSDLTFYMHFTPSEQATISSHSITKAQK